MSPTPSIGIIGFGAFGRLMAHHLAPHFALRPYDPALTGSTLEHAATADIVVLAAPVGQFDAVTKAIAPLLRPGAIVLDVGSVKTLPADIMRRNLPVHVEIVGTHPLFGPQSAANGIAGLKIAICPIRGRSFRRIAAFLSHTLRLQVFLTTPDAHDAEAATVQGMTHMIAKVLTAMEPLPTRMTTRSFDLLLDAIAMVRPDAPEVFQAIERLNPYVPDVRRRFIALAAALETELTQPPTVTPLAVPLLASYGRGNQRGGSTNMRVLVIGAAGMIGRKLTEKLAAGPIPVDHLTLVDVVQPSHPSAETEIADLSQPGTAERLIAARPDLIFHFAAIVSGEAEADFEKGYAVNLDGTRALFEAIRHQAHYRPRVIFTSSVAVFGAPFPQAISDEFFTTPLTSYGTQKAIGELLLADYSRRGFMDGVGIRLPTICVRPGTPNKAASGFFSNIIREPLIGREAVLPVPETVRHWYASPRAAVGFLLHSATMDTEQLGWRRNLSMPGLSATVGDEIAALRHVAGDRAVSLIRREPDPVIERIVSGWAQNFDASRALSLGFKAETDFEQIIRAHVEDELGGQIPVAA